MSLEVGRELSGPAPLVGWIRRTAGWHRRRPAEYRLAESRRFDLPLLVLLLCAIVSIRLVSLGLYPLIDKSESRYAEIAREMESSGDLVVPWLLGEPFMAKPPLSFWLSAASMSIFGDTEFAVRLPSFILLLLTAALLFTVGIELFDVRTALFAVVVLCSMPLHFVLAGTVLTDPALGFCVTLSCTAFISCLDLRRPATHRIRGLLFFAGLGLGLLAKGPVAVALILIPVTAWTLWTRRWRDVWRALPWFSGPLLALLIAAPWFLLMERRIPGFLEYFFIGENIKRFFVPGWGGDMYGHVHQTLPGTIWAFWLLAAFPWTLVFLADLWRRRHRLIAGFRGSPQAFLLLWAISPMVLFTLSRSTVVTYVYPGLPALALLIAGALRAGPEGDPAC